MTYLAVLCFKEGGPAVTGRWEALASAQRTYSGWIHLYDTHPTAVIELVEEAEDGRRVLKRWTRATGEVTK